MSITPDRKGLMADEGFTFSSVIISFFTVAGGIVLALIGGTLLKLEGQLAFYGTFAAGAFVGGFFAARASRGTSALGPALGSILTVGAIVAMVAVTPIGELLWKNGAKDEMLRVGGYIGGSVLVGAALGASISAAALGDSTRSSIPWVLYVAFAVLGACFLAYGGTLAMLIRDHGDGGMGSEDAVHEAAVGVLVGIGVGCLLAGLASGAAARTRILVASFLGGGGACLGFIELVNRVGAGHSDKELQGMIMIAAGGALVTCIGAAIGWAAFGRRGLTS